MTVDGATIAAGEDDGDRHERRRSHDVAKRFSTPASEKYSGTS